MLQGEAQTLGLPCQPFLQEQWSDVPVADEGSAVLSRTAENRLEKSLPSEGQKWEGFLQGSWLLSWVSCG